MIVRFIPLVFLCLMALSLAGCRDSLVYERSVSELNQKASQLIQEGKAAQAVGRLESALDLMPKEPSVRFNLAIAYQANGQWDECIQTLQAFLEQFPNDALKPKVLQSLAVALETKADLALHPVSDKPDAEPKPPTPAAKAQSAQFYQQAIATYTELLKALPADQADKRAEIEGHVAQLQTQLQSPPTTTP